MNYFIFDHNFHSHFINSFLISASLAHNQEKKTEEWFRWKFQDNPFGESILACAEEDGKIVGCVAYGIQRFRVNERSINGAISFETFVNPNYQGKGIFSKLLELAESKIIKSNIVFLLNFPNTKSLKGFINKGWNHLNITEYWIKGKNLLKIPFAFNDLRKGFYPATSNIDRLQKPVFFEQFPSNLLESEITLDYLIWRFFTFPNTEYHYIEETFYNTLIRIGSRGKTKEAQVLFLNIKQLSQFNLHSFLKKVQNKTNYDIISFPISTFNPIRSILLKSGFVKVPNKANVCYKIFDTLKINDADIKQISLSAINYHTY